MMTRAPSRTSAFAMAKPIPAVEAGHQGELVLQLQIHVQSIACRAVFVSGKRGPGKNG
jgi:hypothetical protein